MEETNNNMNHIPSGVWFFFLSSAYGSLILALYMLYRKDI